MSLADPWVEVSMSATTSPLGAPSASVEITTDILSSSSSSSTTEGPDSSLSSPSTPTKSTAAIMAGLPKFVVQIGETVKSGDNVHFKLHVRRSRPQLSDKEKNWQVERRYEDFESLHHSLSGQTNLEGFIIPPLPNKKPADLASSAARSRRQLGGSSKSVEGDNFGLEQRCLERYLSDLLHHPRFGHDRVLADFLEHQQFNAPRRSSLGSRFSLTSMWTEGKNNNVMDADPWFGQERVTAFKLNNALNEVAERFEQRIHIQSRLANQTGQLAIALGASINSGVVVDKKRSHEDIDGKERERSDTLLSYNRLNSLMSKCLEEERRQQESLIETQNSTLGFYWQLWRAHLSAENSMLHKRSTLQLDSEASEKAYVKAKPSKMAALRSIKEERAAIFNRCSRTAREEIERMHDARLKELKETLLEHAESELQCAKRHLQELHSSLQRLKNFEEQL